MGGILFSSDQAVLVRAQGGCQGDLAGLKRECMQFVQKIGPQTDPSQSCCDVVKKVNVTCVCATIPAPLQQMMSSLKVAHVAQFCGNPIPPGVICGSKLDCLLQSKLIGYLSCRAESAVLTSNSNTSTSSISTYSAHKPKKKNYREEPLNIQQFEYSDLVEATNGFSAQKLLGRGSHGCAYKGVLRSGRLVAVKKSSRGGGGVISHAASSANSNNNSNEVDNEIDILSKVHGPRLVNLLGFTNDSRDRLLVVEFMNNGTLYEVLHNSSRPPNWGRRIRLALQTAEAIDTLHSSIPPVIHKDIKSANVLIDRNFNARLGDFGLALRCHVDNFRLRSTPPAEDDDLKIGPQTDPSQSCCDVMKKVNVTCVCDLIPAPVQLIISSLKVAHVAQFCGNPIPPGVICGS
ncbi:serine/threonine-protein kinase-like protein At3g51990 [Telopea speciosissima]|uniref:serine/threonine-protein kinase-like protein At3g51990 n=1 Tax=Telopea speciosissima TaxID=54955 RepID=UPI001CC5AF2F|nr:serine/threonine-protein kinase-like protein At3g51990 [Telopea speciosissima]